MGDSNYGANICRRCKRGATSTPITTQQRSEVHLQHPNKRSRGNDGVFGAMRQPGVATLPKNCDVEAIRCRHDSADLQAGSSTFLYSSHQASSTLWRRETIRLL